MSERVDRTDFLPFLVGSSLTSHPALEMIAEIDDDAYAAFSEDVRVHGIREPIVLDNEDRIIDGRARRRAAAELKIKLPYIRLVQSDVDAFVESSNVQRRHLTAVEKSFIAAGDLVAEHMAARERQGRSRRGETKTARAAAARKRNVSATYVGYADVIARCGDVELRKQVLTEQIPLSMGAKLAVMSAEERSSLVAAIANKSIRLTPIVIPATILHACGIKRFDLDPATIISNPVNARDFYCLERGEDGLKGSWKIDRNGEAIRFIWVNPPYDDPESWVRRAIETIDDDPTIAIWMLLQTRVIGTSGGRIADHRCSDMLHFDKRQRFITADGVEMPGSLNDGSVLYAFGSATCVGLEDFGTVYIPHRPESNGNDGTTNLPVVALEGCSQGAAV